jgi:hypothetical protein
LERTTSMERRCGGTYAACGCGSLRHQLLALHISCRCAAVFSSCLAASSLWQTAFTASAEERRSTASAAAVWQSITTTCLALRASSRLLRRPCSLSSSNDTWSFTHGSVSGVRGEASLERASFVHTIRCSAQPSSETPSSGKPSTRTRSWVGERTWWGLTFLSPAHATAAAAAADALDFCSVSLSGANCG